jgi:hypothetical protein
MRQPSGAWQLMSDWTFNDTFAWTPAVAGTYTIAIWGRSNTTTAEGWQAYAERTFAITN